MANAQNVVIGVASICLDDVELGHTSGGVEVAHEPTFLSIESDQSCGTVRIGRTSEKMMVRTTALEVMLNVIRISMGYSEDNFDNIVTESGGNPQKLWLGGNCDACSGLQEHTLKIKGPAPNCGCRTYEFDRAVSVGQTTIAHQRDQEQQLALEFEILKADDTGFFGFIQDGCVYQDSLLCDAEPASPY
jgi:hypothetical protein